MTRGNCVLSDMHHGQHGLYRISFGRKLVMSCSIQQIYEVLDRHQLIDTFRARLQAARERVFFKFPLAYPSLRSYDSITLRS